MSKLGFGGEMGYLSSDDEDNLPYPEALPRSDFLTPTFDAPAYLSTLSDRHQTLEDLRSDLRERSQALSTELLDLVNTNYEQFLSLGSDLKGGEEKVDDVRVGLLGFKRGVEDVRRKVTERKVEVEMLLKEQKGVNGQIALGRNLLEVDARLEELEDRLMMSSLDKSDGLDDDSWSDSDEDELEEENGIEAGAFGVNKLHRMVLDYRIVEKYSSEAEDNHPFIAAQLPRMLRIRNTILLDLSTALKQAVSSGDLAKSKIAKIMAIYRDLDAGGEAVKVLKDLKPK